MKKSVSGSSENAIVSKLTSLEKLTIAEDRFSVPIYQRLYVWKEEQISTLLSMIYQAFGRNDDYYYLGGVILVRNKEGMYDLIDGQQRFTTLWLIGHIVRGSLEKFIYAESASSKKPRLTFAIREFTNKFLKSPAIMDTIPDVNKAELLPLAIAIETIKGFCNQMLNENDMRLFSDYIYRRVWLAVTEMPPETDENKLFEATNNRGEQLQQHEILKSRLLRYIGESERLKYDQIWSACSLMDDYIEKNIKDISKKKWKELLGSDNQHEREAGLSDNILNRLNGDQVKSKSYTLLSILESNEQENQGRSGSAQNEWEYDSGKVRSIISFPMLLLHTLRIFLFDKKRKRAKGEIPPVDSASLLQIFDKFFGSFFNERDVRDFIILQWNIRVRFDRHIIKWGKTENSEVHVIKKLYLNNDTLQRRDPETNQGFVLLQSMLYHSQEIITHYWLTPFLYKLLQDDSERELYAYLRQLDNAMFCTNQQDELSSRSWNLIGQVLSKGRSKVEYLQLDDSKGTRFPSYIFLKLDYALWYMRTDIFSEMEGKLDATMRKKWNDFRLTSRNSVEHISSQNPKETDQNVVWSRKDSDEVKKEKLDDFGNLTLLTKGMNSEYSNKAFKVKREEFLESSKLDSPKSSLIFLNERWSYELCNEHREKMKRYLQLYFDKPK